MSKLAKLAKKIKEQENDDIDYLKREGISSVLSIALGELYMLKPKNQLNFLGNWLINHSAAQKQMKIEVQRASVQENLKAKHEKSLQEKLETESKLKSEAERIKKTEEDLKTMLENTTEIDDHLEEIIEHIKERISAVAGYIGLQEKLKRPVNPLDDEKAHIDDDAPIIIRYIATTSNSKFMFDKILREEEGQATWSLWKEEEEAQDEENPDEEKKPKMKIVSIDDVVNDSRIKYFDVPKLGAYLAIPLNYKSYLSDSSFDAGIDDALECKRLRAQQEEEKLRVENAGENEEVKEFEEIKPMPYKFNEVKLVVAFDTLGHDKIFTEDQKEYAYQWVKFTQEQWERAEMESLSKDIEAFLPVREGDIQRLNEKSANWADEERNIAEEVAKNINPSATDETRHLETQSALFELHKTRVLQEIETLFAFSRLKVVKFPRVFQLAFYLSGVCREEVVEPGTNMIQWKKAKKFLNQDFENFLNEAKPRGPKETKPEAYAKTAKLEKDLQKIVAEDVQNYSVSLLFLYKFLEFYLKVRILDVAYRRKEYLNKAETRENAIKDAQDLKERRQKFIDEAKENYEKNLEGLEEGDERPEFELEKVIQEFNEMEGNGEVEIPPEISPDEDADLDWEETNPA